MKFLENRPDWRADAHERAKPFSSLEREPVSAVTWVGYTTKYREGGTELERSAKTLAKRLQRDGHNVQLDRIESKREFVDAVQSCASIRALHFVGHAGMYGPMFRTTSMPEQFSPHEWRELNIPFAEGAEAYFHACRTGRWFAAFFARTFAVPCHGYHWYTTFSASPERFVRPAKSGELFVIGCKGRKSHGLRGSLIKYAGFAAAEPLKRFEPPGEGDSGGSYDEVAELYAATFADIRVRADEWRFLSEHLPEKPVDVLDIGCGNGALLRQLSGRLRSGVGVDASDGMIRLAAEENKSDDKLRFEAIKGPRLPVEDQSVDVVTSLLSFRYLDWDPLMSEVTRVLRPGGRLLVVDMVTAPVKTLQIPELLLTKAKTWFNDRRHPAYQDARAKLVAHPGWREMLAYNPIRAEHEMVWYLESRFPGRKVERLNLGLSARVLAFDSGPLQGDWFAPQSYP
ncbi:MAG: ubiquinone/menaquinone biosynthesis C-methylase UbiE [Polyangiales bacterium]